ncbi:exonuclease mut-7 homolog [Anneissia japonica]|uniref:exonuclease mut-7 homolog n=1 Tax=Anneissia japonica TaxID=1529436 RepID=UPI001425AB4B|nr:exonuclease mut-7 homolog [Anneissia japonica]
MQRPHGRRVPTSVVTMPTLSKLQSWLEEFEKLWTGRKDAEIKMLAEKLFTEVKQNVFEVILFLMGNSQDHFRKKTDSWTKTVLKRFLELKESLQKNEKDLFDACLTQEMQQRALYLATCGHYNVLSLICHLFRLDTGDNRHLTGHLNVMLERQQFKEVCRCITQLNLQHCFSIHQVVVPLVLQDKVNLVETYCKKHKKLQIQLLQYLDQFCANGFDVDFAIGNLGVPGVRKDKLCPRVMRKLVARLLKMYNLESEICPNYDKTKNMGALKYLLYKRYNEPASCSSNWEDFVEQAVGDNHILQDELILQFICYDDLQAAVKWAKKLNVSSDRMPEQVVAAIAEAQSATEEEDWEASYTTEEAVVHSTVDYYQLNLPFEKIVVVDQEYMVENCIQHLTKVNKVIGIDMEWKPSFLSTTSRVAVIQLACYTQIYLIDVPVIAQNPDCMVWLMESILCDKEILKLGYGINHDLQMLVKSYPFLADCVKKTLRMNDLASLQSKFESMKPDIFGTPDSDMISKGLSGLVNRCFGQPLDKREQMSDWESRPLSQSQIVYGALDAYCLLEVFDFMKVLAESSSLDIDMESGITTKTPKKVKPRKKRDKEKSVNAVSSLANLSISSDRHKDPISPADLSVVCDTMLQGLGKQLRSCGVDVKILENDQDHYQAVKIAKTEGRIILTRGTPYISLRSQVGDDRCYLVRSLKACDQLVEVLNFHNVHVTPKDIFSRCQMCNGNGYAKVTSATMRIAFEKKNANQQQQHSMQFGPAEMGAYSDPYGFDLDDAEDEMEFFLDSDVTSNKASGYYDDYVNEYISLENTNSKFNIPTEKPHEQEDEGAVACSSNGYKESFVSSDHTINLDDLTVGDGVQVQMDVLQESMFDNVDIFFCCIKCGKIYWEGKHFCNVLEQFSHILHRGPDRQGRDVLGSLEQNDGIEAM